MPEVTLLYAAFAVVALWLLGELLLQRRAPLHWRALALVGFLVLVAGVVQGSLPLIGAGVLAFAAGQALATRAVKSFAGVSHWSLVAPESVPVVGRLFGGEQHPPAPKGRSRAARPLPDHEPVSPAEPLPLAEPPLAEPGPSVHAEAVEATAVFQADEYAVEGDSVYYPQSGYPQPEPQEQQAAYYAYTADQQVSYDAYGQPYQQAYQEPYQDYGQYQQYPGYEQQYAAYEQQQYGQQYGQEHAQQYAQPGGYEPAQTGYDYEQAPYYAPDPQQHAPQG